MPTIFLRFPQYEYKQPFDPSLMVYSRKRLTPEILEEINELIIRKAKKESEEERYDNGDDSGKPQSPQNSGTIQYMKVLFIPFQILKLQEKPAFGKGEII